MAHSSTILLVPHDHQSAVLPGIRNFFLDLYFHVAPWVLPDPAGPLSSEQSPSTIAEANAALNCVQQAKTKETKKQEVDQIVHPIHCMLGVYAFHSIDF